MKNNILSELNITSVTEVKTISPNDSNVLILIADDILSPKQEEELLKTFKTYLPKLNILLLLGDISIETKEEFLEKLDEIKNKPKKPEPRLIKEGDIKKSQKELLGREIGFWESLRSLFWKEK